MYLDPPRSAKWMGVGVPLRKPLRAQEHHPFEVELSGILFSKTEELWMFLHVFGKMLCENDWICMSSFLERAYQVNI